LSSEVLLLAATGTSDAVDAHLVVLARRLSEPILTAHINDLTALATEARAHVIDWNAAAEGSVSANRRAVRDRCQRGCSTLRIIGGMTTPIPTRFNDAELRLIDELVENGVGTTRSSVIRRGVHHLADSVRRARIGAQIADSYRTNPQSEDDDALAMASALAMTEAESW